MHIWKWGRIICITGGLWHNNMPCILTIIGQTMFLMLNISTRQKSSIFVKMEASWGFGNFSNWPMSSKHLSDLSIQNKAIPILDWILIGQCGAVMSMLIAGNQLIYFGRLCKWVTTGHVILFLS